MSEEFVEEPLEQSSESVVDADIQENSAEGDDSLGDQDASVSAEKLDEDNAARAEASDAEASGNEGGDGEGGGDAQTDGHGGADEENDENQDRTDELTKTPAILPPLPIPTPADSVIQSGASREAFNNNSMLKLGASREALDSRRESAVKSVHEKELMRLVFASSKLSIHPISRRGDGTNSERPRTTQDASHSAAEVTRLSRSASEPFRKGGSSPLPYNRKILTPGPGAYNAQTDRFGSREGTGTGFGKAQQRPHHVCIFDHVVSPGPIYAPATEIMSSKSALPCISFPKREMGTRFNLSATMPSNCPHWNPGPAEYRPGMLHSGKSPDTGPNAPMFAFSKSGKLVSPYTNLSATPFISNAHSLKENAHSVKENAHSLKENVGVHSPGPVAYEPRNTSTKKNSFSMTMAPKSASYFDSYFDPARQTSPGPIYETKTVDNRGHKTLGGDFSAVFGRLFQAITSANYGIGGHIRLVKPDPDFFNKDLIVMAE
eukprot:gene20927-27775_t